MCNFTAGICPSALCLSWLTAYPEQALSIHTLIRKAIKVLRQNLGNGEFYEREAYIFYTKFSRAILSIPFLMLIWFVLLLGSRVSGHHVCVLEASALIPPYKTLCCCCCFTVQVWTWLPFHFLSNVLMLRTHHRSQMQKPGALRSLRLTANVCFSFPVL